MALFYLSFANDDGWLGGNILEAESHIDAIEESHRRLINPGGEVAVCAFQQHQNVPDIFRNRLLDMNDIVKLNEGSS